MLWCGDDGIKRVEDMTREELLVVVKYLADRLQGYQTPEMSELIGAGYAAKLRRSI